MQASELFETNPVLASEELVRSIRADPLRWGAAGHVLDEPIARLSLTGHGLPQAALESWVNVGVLSKAVAETAARAWQPGVLGLVHGEVGGAVVPLTVQPAGAWKIAGQLPVQSSRLVDLLVSLLTEARVLDPGVLPEARAFSVETSFPWPCLGTSMDVAAVLAVIHCAAGAPSALARACAVVEVDGAQMRPVDGVEAKLRAFVRECGQGTVLVRHPGCRASAAFAASFDEVWVVSSTAQLAGHLAPLGVFESWSTDGPFGLSEANLVLGRLRDLQRSDPDHEAIVRLARRALQCSWRSEVPPAVRHRPRLDLLRSLRHLGSYADALQVGEQWRQEVRGLGDASSLEQLAEGDLEFAAGLFDPAQFERMLEVLEPWLQRIEAEPICLSPGLRVRIWNTAARAMVRIEQDGWRELLERSMELQVRTDPAGVPRTRNYLIEALLQAGSLKEAEQQIGQSERSDLDPTSRSMLAFLRADLARRGGSVWADDLFEAEHPRPNRANHPLGLYLQATARQPARSAHDASRRLRKAGECFAFDAERAGDANILWVLAHCMDLAADLHAGRSTADASVQLGNALQQPGLETLHSRLGPLPAALDGLEQFLDRLPWT